MSKIKEIDHFPKRLLMCVLGVIICAISVGFFKRASFGVDPFQALMSGLNAVIPLPFGTLYVIANVILLLFALIADRHFIGIATVINLFLVGYIVDFSHRVLLWALPELGMPGRIICLLIAIVIMCLASSFYFTADLGVSTYDAVALIITGTWHKGQFRWVRIVTDLICVAVGVALYLMAGGTLSGIGEVAGVGTIITAFFMGPLIDFFNRKVAQPFLR
ncbi:MAG: hypothetical protein LIO94_07765 [Clostridiales bacterium]|nr:hypothetical protein [Clostridiales bacterium]